MISKIEGATVYPAKWGLLVQRHQIRSVSRGAWHQRHALRAAKLLSGRRQQLCNWQEETSHPETSRDRRLEWIAPWLTCKWIRCSHAHESWILSTNMTGTPRPRFGRLGPRHALPSLAWRSGDRNSDRSSAIACAITIHVRCVGVSPPHSTSTAWSIPGTHLTEPI